MGIVEYMESERRRGAFLEALQYLLESDMIEDEKAKGITRQIIGEGTLDNLTDKQVYLYEQIVLPLIEVKCDGHCDGIIDIEDFENAHLREIELGGLYCQHCMYDIEKNL